MMKVRELQNQKNGFLKSDVCKSCFLPRKTYDEKFKVQNREVIVQNYEGVDQEVGESKF